MAQLVVKEDIKWKKGEEGVQKFILYDSDGKTRHNGTGHTYQMKFWKDGSSSLKGTGSLSPTSAVDGEYDMVVASAFTDTVDEYLGEIIEDPTGSKLRSNTFNIFVEKSSAGLT